MIKARDQSFVTIGLPKILSPWKCPWADLRDLTPVMQPEQQPCDRYKMISKE
ncbi:hypothetical protein [Egbenema bharatensis]|uniref:hypothetical protein n=1 Tax=Egbenema bharatensis TaxID=3463334 RepID=UPI003A85BFCE